MDTNTGTMTLYQKLRSTLSELSGQKCESLQLHKPFLFFFIKTAWHFEQSHTNSFLGRYRLNRLNFYFIEQEPRRVALGIITQVK